MRAYLSLTDHDTISVTDFNKKIPDAEARTQDELNDALLPYADPSKCPRVEARVACEECGYPMSEAMYDDGPMPHEANLSFQFSSSMDFPDEYTSDPIVLETVEWVMS